MTKPEIPERWQYGDAGDRYPIDFGDILQVNGNVLVCGDHAKGHGQALIEAAGKPDMVYVDPPWDKGNARAFRTKAGFDDGPVDFRKLLEEILRLCKQAKYEVFIEIGKRNKQNLVDLIEAEGGTVHEVWDVTYYGSKPSHLLLATFNGAPRGDYDFTGLDDEDTPFGAAYHYASPNDLIVDPCIGRGLIAKAALDADCRVAGLELHPRRLACTVDAIVDHYTEKGEETSIEKIGSVDF